MKPKEWTCLSQKIQVSSEVFKRYRGTKSLQLVYKRESLVVPHEVHSQSGPQTSTKGKLSGPLSHIPSKSFWCLLKFENHCLSISLITNSLFTEVWQRSEVLFLNKEWASFPVDPGWVEQPQEPFTLGMPQVHQEWEDSVPLKPPL